MVRKGISGVDIRYIIPFPKTYNMPTMVNFLLLYIAIITVTTNSLAVLSIITETSQWNACPDNKLFKINPTVGDFYVG